MISITAISVKIKTWIGVKKAMYMNMAEKRGKKGLVLGNTF